MGFDLWFGFCLFGLGFFNTLHFEKKVQTLIDKLFFLVFFAGFFGVPC